jgi:hypothetical protein
VALAKRMLFVELTKVEGDWLWNSGMTSNMPEVGFAYFSRIVLESVEGRMGNITGYVEPIAWCD